MDGARQPRPELEFRVLGALELRRYGEDVPLRSARQRALLARLLLDAGRVVPLDALADALWGDEPPADPRNAVQTYVAHGMWRGQAFAEFADGFARSEAMRLAELRLVALETRAASRLELGEAAGVAGELEALVGEHPWRERFVELNMRALAALGRDREALGAYRAYRERLAEEDGLDPSKTLADLEGAILRGELAAPRRQGALQRGQQIPVGQAIPPSVTSLVGRGREIAETGTLLAEGHLVTLTGPGGVGKTRVAVEAATAAHAAGREVAWADLAPVADPTAVLHVIATAAGVDLPGGQPGQDALIDALVGRSVLLVLDNCEHLVDTVAPMASALHQRCPSVGVLATGRERLAVDGERVLAVKPLRIGPHDDEAPEAVRLFLERAEAVSDIDPSETIEVVGEICRELDGLPLAIELAASRTGALPLDGLLAVLREDATAATGRRRSPSGRHQDLWAVVEWSYRLLDEPEQRLFERLSVFAGAFGVGEAHLVCAPEGQTHGVTVAQLAALAEQSLLAGPLLDPAVARRRYRLALYWFDYWGPGSEVMGWAEDALGMTGLDEQPTAPQVYAAAARPCKLRWAAAPCSSPPQRGAADPGCCSGRSPWRRGSRPPTPRPMARAPVGCADRRWRRSPPTERLRSPRTTLPPRGRPVPRSASNPRRRWRPGSPP